MDKKGKVQNGRTEIIYSGAEKYQAGLAFIPYKETFKRLLGHWEISDRVIGIKIHTKPCYINVIQVYATTTEHEEVEADKFYENIVQ